MPDRKKEYSAYPNKFSRKTNSWAQHWYGSILLTSVVLIAYIFFSTLCGVSYGLLNGTLAIEIAVIIVSLSLLYHDWGAWDENGKFQKSLLKKPFRKNNLGLIVILVLLFIWLFLISQSAGSDLINLGDKTFDSNMKQVMQNPFLYTLAGCFLAPISEELMYRGVIYSLLKKAFPVLVSAILQALIFALMHGTIVQFPVAFGLGIFNAMIVQMTDCYVFDIGFHMLFNIGAQFVTPHLPNVFSNLQLALAIYTINIILILLLFVWYLKKQRQDLGVVKQK